MSQQRAAVVMRLAQLIARILASPEDTHEPPPKSQPIICAVAQSSTYANPPQHRSSIIANRPRQYQLAERAVELGWHREDVTVLDEEASERGNYILFSTPLCVATNRRMLLSVPIRSAL